MTEIPPMNSVVAHLMEELYIKRVPDLSEEEFMKYARNNFFKPKKAQPEGPLLRKSLHLWLAKLEGAGGKGRQLLPVGVLVEGQIAREFNASSQPPVILERDYPGATLEQAANIFSAQALALYRTEMRSSTIGPDMTALIRESPVTTLNSDREEVEQEFVQKQQMMRIRYANTVLPILDISIPNSVPVIFDSTRGRHEVQSASHLSIGMANHATGLAFPMPKGNEQVKLISLQVKSSNARKAIDGAILLTNLLEKELQSLCFVCSRGDGAVIYIGGGPIGTFSVNQLYDFLASNGMQVGSGAVNSKIPYKDIDLPLYGVRIVYITIR